MLATGAENKANRNLAVTQEDKKRCEKNPYRATFDHHFPRAREEQQSAQGLERFQVRDRLPPSPRPSVLPGQLLHHNLHVSDYGEGDAHPFGKNSLRRQPFSGKSKPNGRRGHTGEGGRHETTGE